MRSYCLFFRSSRFQKRRRSRTSVKRVSETGPIVLQTRTSRRPFQRRNFDCKGSRIGASCGRSATSHGEVNGAIVPIISSKSFRVSMVMPGVFVSGEVCSDDSTLIFEQHGDESNAIAAFHSAASGSYEYNKARNALAHWYYPYHLGATQRLWNHNRERIFLYSAYLSQVCEQLPSRVRVEARTNISRGPNGPQRPTNAYTYDVIYSGEFYPNSGRIELIADDEEMEQQVFAALEEMWRSQAQQLIEFQRQLDVGFAFVALGVAGIHATSECNQFPVGHPERSPLCD